MRLHNNASGNDYVSTAATDPNGLATVNNVPPGSYTVFVGPSSGSTPTATGDNNFLVAPSFDAINSIAYAATITPDASISQIVSVGTLTNNITVAAPTSPTSGQKLTFLFTQDGTGGRTVTWNATFKTAWTPSQIASKISSVTFFYDGANWQQEDGASVDDAGNITTKGAIVGSSFTATGPYSAQTIPSVSTLNGEAWALPPNGIDDTTALDAFFTAVNSSLTRTPKMRLWDGIYRYNGAGWDGTSFRLAGAGAQTNAAGTASPTSVLLGANCYLINTTQINYELELEKIGFYGGAGAFRSSYAGVSGSGQHRIDACYFKNYTKAAIGHNSQDMPGWKITRSQFYGTATSFGIALAGFNDVCSIVDCDFWLNAVHVKLGRGAVRTNIDKCSFLEFAGGNGRIHIWVVPTTSDAESNPGFQVADTSFGAENLDASDYRVVYADEIAGADFTTNLPDLTHDSTGFITEHSFMGVSLVGGSGAFRVPFVYSTTPNVDGCLYGPLKIHQNAPSYLLQYRTPPVAGFGGLDGYNNRNMFGPFLWASQAFDDVHGPLNNVPPLLSNAQGIGYVSDPHGLLQDNLGLGQLVNPGGADYDGYARLFRSACDVATLTGGMTKAQIADSEGRIDAQEFTATGSGSFGIFTLSQTFMVPGAPIWIEFDLKVGSASPLATIRMSLSDTGQYNWTRVLTPPATWQRYRFLTYARGVPAVAQLVLNVFAAGTVDVGRVRVYHAREPIPYAAQFYTDPTAKVVALTDAAAVVVDASLGTYFTLAALASPRTINNPLTTSGGVSGLLIGMTRTFDILNSTGGALVTTWSANYKLAGAWTDPANGKRRKITFTFVGSNSWIEDSRVGGDI